MYLGIDIGTSAVKALIVDDEGQVRSQTQAPLTVSRPHPLWSEQDPTQWWQATEIAVGSLDRAFRNSVRAIGLSGQMHGATLLDDRDRPLRAAILWNDGRAATQCRELELRQLDSRIITGNIAMPGFTAPKLLWIQQHESELFRRLRRVLLPKDYVRLRMTGEYATDVSDASGTLWLDVARRSWSSEMLAATNLDERHMPRLLEGPEPSGVLRSDIAAKWGLLTPVIVAAGGGDNAAGAIGVGVIDPGQGLLSLGTSGVIFAADNQFRPNPRRAMHAFCHCVPERWHEMSVMLSAAACLDWVAKLAGYSDVDTAIAEAERLSEISSTEIFLPYLSGERTPHNDLHAQGVFFGLNHDTTAASLVRAVLEGVAFGLADGLDALREAGVELTRLSVIGGGSRSTYWGRILAASLGLPLDYRSGADLGPAYGAARLARLAATRESAETLAVPPPLFKTVEPEPSLVDAMQAKRAVFSELYIQLKRTFPKIRHHLST
jgi:xylulokinase